ncbi:MAG: histidine phosphatase family protein [Pseudomonadota bacterium]
MGVVTVVRHGQASFGSANYDQLSPLGEWQATQLGQHFCTASMRFNRALCGDLVRQQQTAERVLGGLADAPCERAIDAAFDEYPTKPVFGRHLPTVLERDPELRDAFARDRVGAGRDRAWSRRVFFPVLSAWQADGEDVPFESFARFRARIEEGLKRLVQSHRHGDSSVVFTSAGVVAVAVMYALDLPDAAFAPLAWQVHNASISRFSVDDGAFHLLQFNGVGYLEATGRLDALTWL